MGDHQEQPQGRSGSDGLHLPPGFRFYPKDEEIITFYLIPKVHQRNFTCTAIGEVDFNRTEPWELPGKAKMGEKGWYFFYQKDRKHPMGTRMNRATMAGYWKATGKDKEIYRAAAKEVMPLLVGMKKTLVFYKGRAPRGEKTDWVMHEFRLEGSGGLPYPTSSSTSTTNMTSSISDVDEWVVGRVFHKTTGMKRTPALPSYDLATADDGTDQSSIPIPTLLPFPMLSDFIMDPVAPYYSTMGTSSSLVPPVMSPLAGMGSIGLHMHNNLFGNPMAVVPPASIYHQMGMGVVGAGGFMDALKSGPSPMASQKDIVMDRGQTNAAEISQMVLSAAVGASNSMDALKCGPSQRTQSCIVTKPISPKYHRWCPLPPDYVPIIDMDGIWKY